MNRLPENSFLSVGAYLLGSLFIVSVWVWGADSPLTSVNGDPRSTLPDLVYGRAHNPFAQRVLVPLVTRALIAVLPQDMNSSLQEMLSRSPGLQREVQRMGWDVRYLEEHLVAFGIDAASLFFFAMVIRSLFFFLYDTERWAGDVIPLCALACLPPFFLVGTHYIYDFPALLFFTLGLLLLIRREWMWYYLAFGIGCLNKETMMLLAVAFAIIHRRRMLPSRLAAHLAAQLVIFGAIKTALSMAFSGNPGGMFEVHLVRNLHEMLLPYSFASLLAACVVGLLVLHRWNAKPLALRQASWLLVPFGVLMVCCGMLYETRALYEIFPIFFLLAIHTILFTWLNVPYRMKAEVP